MPRPPGRARHRSLDYRRIFQGPDLMLCHCSPCRKERGRRVTSKDYPRLGDKFPGCEYVNPERVFAETWEDECQPRPGLNFGMGILQDLMVVQRGGSGLFGGRVAFWITKRERVIVATVVQWLGTRVGWCFLEGCLRKCGYSLVETAVLDDLRGRPKPPPPPPPPGTPYPTSRFFHLRRRAPY